MWHIRCFVHQVPLADVPEPVVATASEWLGEQPVEELGIFVVKLLKDALEDVQTLGTPSKTAATAAGAPNKAKARRK